jgi:predicted glycogen debranching enzyme
MEFDLSREWLETNGLGSFASGTVVGANSRRYHALLCLATQPPQGRLVMVNKIDEVVTVSHEGQSRHFELGCNQYPGVVSPCGYRWLRDFHLDPLPRWVYVIPASAHGLKDQGDLVIEKALWMPHEVQATVVTYRLLNGPDCQVSGRAFVSGRDFHGTHHANDDFDPHVEARHAEGSRHITMRPYSTLAPVVFSLDGEFHGGGAWYYDFEYAVERERGLDFHEDAWCPGSFDWRLSSEAPTGTLVVAAQEFNPSTMRETRGPESGRRLALCQSLCDNAPEADADHTRRLVRAADQFVVRRRDGLHTILAGYPWFSDWGRDTMIALHGTCLTTGRTGEALSILLAFAQASSQGMIPNRFPDAGEIPDYNTIDATLWFFHAVGRYFEAVPDDRDALQVLFPTLRDIMEWHWAGTRYGIRADPDDGLLAGGDYRTQLTWMDAKIGDTAFTPRAGKPVEIQALWFNALKTMARLAEQMEEKALAAQCNAWSRKAKANFGRLFWNEEAGCLYDHIEGSYRNGQIRPNQIFAVSLPHRLLPLDLEKRVVSVVERELLTPYGLRSLSPRDPDYRGIYIGSAWQRDSSYHQGTVWTWPIGAFLTAYLRVNRHSPRARQQVRQWLSPLMGHLNEAGLGSICEIFDGDAPHTPRGCPAQAWSVSEVLRVLAEEVA